MVSRASRRTLSLFVVLGIAAFTGCSAIRRPQPDTHTVGGNGVPVLTGIDPDVAASGDTVTIKGQGFSFVAPENVIAVGGTSIVADGYAVSEGGFESLTFKVPEDAVGGETEILVVVEGNPSNTLPFVVETAP